MLPFCNCTYNMDPQFKYHFNARQVQTSRTQLDSIGQGSYGRVHKVYTTKLGVSAAKIFPITGTVDRQNDVYRVVEYEAKILALINHENIVRFHGISAWSHYFAIIMDYEVGGSLHDLLKNALVIVLPWRLRLRMVHETVKALVYLHNSGVDDRVVHGDLKSCNILLSEDLRVRVADFGAAILATKTCDQTARVNPHPSARVHTVVFSAPEFLSDVFARRAKAMDIFSLGRVIYELITRLTPFQDENFENITDAIVDGATPNVSMIPNIRRNLIERGDDDLAIMDGLCAMMDRCCSHRPSARPDIMEVQANTAIMMSQVSSILILRDVHLVVNQTHVRLTESPKESRIPLHEFV